MKKRYIKLTSILFVFIITACSKIIYITNYNDFKNIGYDQGFWIFTQEENVPKNSILISDFDYRESYSLDFDYLKPKLEKIAKDKGANILKINEFHIGDFETKGAAGRILGSIYRLSDTLAIKEHIDSLNNEDFADSKNKAFLYIYRSDWGGPSLFDINVYVNNEFVTKLNKRDIARVVLKKEGITFISSSKSEEYNFGMNIDVKFGSKYYLKVTQSISSSASNNSISVMIGDKYFVLIDEQQGKVEFEQVKQSIKTKE
jgi:hypothetical protein